MATKAQVIKMLEAIPDGEPVFLLRGQDRLAPNLVDFWAGAALSRGAPPKKAAEARACAQKMREWPRRKWPD